MVQTIVRPPRANDFSSAISCEQVELSRPLVGSSKNITGGLLTSSSAIDRRFRWPPERLSVSVLAASSRPSVSIISSTTARFADTEMSLPSFRLADTIIASRTVRYQQQDISQSCAPGERSEWDSNLGPASSKTGAAISTTAPRFQITDRYLVDSHFIDPILNS
uniref:Uncharacterized protein n=1 Tax=Anopheles culicifacies TaxID=139723 RepID=A0A182LTP1_9DIPT